MAGAVLRMSRIFSSVLFAKIRGHHGGSIQKGSQTAA